MTPRKGDLIERALTRSIIGAFYDVDNALGHGFLEHIYSLALERELRAEVGLILHFGAEPRYQRFVSSNPPPR